MNAPALRSTDRREPVHEARLALAVPDLPMAINAPLVPESYCHQVLAEPTPPPCGIEAGTRLARLLVGAYPAREVNDPRIYAVALAGVFAEFSEAVGRAAIDTIVRRLKFMPTAADVHEACSEIAGRYAQRRVVASQMLAEHERRRREALRDTEIDRDRADVLADMSDPDGAWANVKHQLAAARLETARPRQRAITARWTAPTEQQAAEHAERYAAAMAELEAAGLPTESLNRGD